MTPTDAPASSPPRPEPGATASDREPPGPTICVVGSGPAGCFTAQALLKDWPTAQITVLDRLPAPFGLVRYGVAPDHQGTKAVTTQFDRLFQQPAVTFLGNVQVGRDVSVEELQEAFDVVLLATGLSADVGLDVPGSDLAGIHGAGRVTRLFNGHPDEAGFTPAFGERVVVIGHGNVAVDVVRLLAKRPEDFEGSDVDDDLLQDLHRHPVQRIDVVGRSAAELAKFDVVMVKELAHLDHVRFTVAHEEAVSPGEESLLTSKVAALDELAGASPPSEARVEVCFRFGWRPEAFLGEGGVSSVLFAAADGSGRRLEVPADSVVTAVGFSEDAASGLARATWEGATSDLASGRLREGLYCAGWFRRGPRGTIPDNRRDAKLVSAAISQDLRAGAVRTGRPGVSSLPARVRAAAVDYAAWRRVDDHERASARPGRVRSKIRSVPSMLSVASRPEDDA